MLPLPLVVFAVAAVVVVALILSLVARSRLPSKNLPEDYHELRPTFLVQVSSVAFYVFLVVRAVTLDAVDLLVGRLLGQQPRRVVEPVAFRAGPPLKSGLKDVYERRMYGRISDTFNRPITGEAGGEVTVCAREWSQKTGELELTGEKIRCLNLGSYNYLGFGGCVARPCAQAVRRPSALPGDAHAGPRPAQMRRILHAPGAADSDGGRHHDLIHARRCGHGRRARGV